MEKIGTELNGFRVLVILTKPRKHPRKVNGFYKETWFIVACLKCGHIKETRAQSLRAGRTGCKQGPCHPKFIDLSGRVFGDCRVLKYVKTQHSHAPWRWLCRCACGADYTAIGSLLLRDECTRCLPCSRKLVGKKNKKPDDESKWNRVYREYKRAAKNKNRQFLLSKEEVRGLCSLPCYYCGGPPNREDHRHVKRNGIDRVDSSVGYLINNCVTSCFTCNFWKSDKPTDDFLNHVSKIYNYKK